MAEIRCLTVDELHLCEPLAQAFHLEAGLPSEFSFASFQRQWVSLLTTPGITANILGLFSEDVLIGGFGALLAPEINTGRLDANELFWFITKEYRGGSHASDLFRAFEQWGRIHGAQGFKVVHLIGSQDKKLNAFYTSLGYEPIEVTYMKVKE